MSYKLELTERAERHLRGIEEDRVIVVVISLKGHYSE